MLKLKKILPVIILIPCVLMFCFFYLRVNKQYPNPAIEICPFGKETEYNGFTLKVNSFNMLSIPEFLEKYPNFQKQLESLNYFEPGTQANVMLISMNISNTADMEKHIELYDFTAESLDWFNGADMELFNLLNGNDISLQPTLSPNQKISVIMPYYMYNFQFSQDVWEDIGNRSFHLVYQLYPVKKEIRVS